MEWYVEINGYEFEVELHIDYQPAERMTLDYPGCHEEICISTVSIFGNELPSTHPIVLQVEADYDNIFEEYLEDMRDSRCY